MRKLIVSILGGIILLPSLAMAVTVPWNRPTAGQINPLYMLDEVKVNYLTSTSTSATSTFAAGVSMTRFNTTATSTGSQGINLTGGCFSINGSCLTSGGGGSWPFTPTTYSGVAVQSTSTPLWLTATSPFSLIATSTFATNASSTLSSCVTCWGGSLTLTTPLGIASGGTNASSFTAVNGLTAYDGTRLVNFSGYTLTSALMTITNSTTTNASVTSFLAIPNSSSQTVTAAGQIAIDTTSDEFKYFGGSQRVLSYDQDKSFILSTSTLAYYGAFAANATTSNLRLWNPKRAVTITDFYCIGTNGTSTISVGNGSATSTVICGKDIAGSASSLSISVSARGNLFLNAGTLVGAAAYFTPTLTYTYDAD